MRAVVKVTSGKFELQEIPKPEADGINIVTKVLKASICGSDISMWKAQNDRYDNLVLGHEYCLEVEDPGASPYKKGDRIVALPTGGCLFCDRCKEGFYAHCLNRKPDGEPYADAPGVRTQGAFAQYLKIRPELTYLVPEGMSSEVATLMEPLSFGFHSINSAIERDGKLGERVLVTGGGIIAVLICEILKSKGVEYIAMTEVNPERAKHAIETGVADEVFDPTKEGDIAGLAKASGAGFDVGFECAGRGDAIDLMCKFVKRRGTIIQAGISFTPISFTNLVPIMKELTLIHVYGSPGKTMEEALELANQINDRLEKHITYPNVTLEEIQGLFEKLASGVASGIKYIVDPQK